jgi:hypothetical protein
MRKIWPLGHDDESLCHSGFRLLREDQEMDLGFFTEAQIRKFVEEFDRVHETDPFPMLYE